MQKLKFAVALAFLWATVVLALCACAAGVALPSYGRCVAYGVTVKRTVPRGRTSESAGCIEDAPVPGETYEWQSAKGEGRPL
jgi:hypothetical protein